MSALEAAILSVLRTPRETSGSLVPESDTRLIEIEEHDLLLCWDLRQQEAKPLPRGCSLFKETKKGGRFWSPPKDRKCNGVPQNGYSF